MISSTPSSDRPERTDSNPVFPPKPRGRAAGIGSDQFTAEKIELLRNALASQPEIRPEVVERGRALAADPSWPPHEVLRRVSEIIIRAPDLTEDVS